MEAKDTVMSKKQLAELNANMPPEAKYGEVFEVIAGRQAELSFKAGTKTDKWEELIRIIEERILDVNLTAGNSVFSDAFQRDARVIVRTLEGILGTIKRLRKADGS